MSEVPVPSSSNEESKPLPKITLGAAVLVLLLALGAVFFPRVNQYEMQGVFLVLDAPGGRENREGLFGTMAEVLAELSGHAMTLVIVDNRLDFLRGLSEGADFVLCPDGVAIDLPVDDFGSLVAGRRKLPSNLRPRGVMVYRRSGEMDSKPWVNHPDRTVFGDSLSLVAVGGIGVVSSLRSCTFGPDPFDHSPVLHALRLGAFDYALVRQWDANNFFARGLLDSAVWGVEERTVPVPDIVIFASRQIPVVERLKWAQSLALIGRSDEKSPDHSGRMVQQLGDLGLVGFNLLLEPDFEMVRRNFQGNWPLGTD